MKIHHTVGAAALAALLTALPACQAPQASLSADQAAVSAGAFEPPPPADVSLPPEPEPVPLTQEEVSRILEETMDSYTATGVSVAVIEDGAPGASAAWGWAVRDVQEMTPDTKVRVASLSKVAVGMCAIAMAEDGLVDLDAPLSDYWGAAVQDPYAQTQPSAKSLMSHSSGVKDFAITRGLSTLKNTLSASSAWRSPEPGTAEAWYYSNYGICVLGTTLELASGQILDDYFQNHFLQPMGIQASFFGGRMEGEQVATLYGPSGVAQRTREQQTGQSVPDQVGAGASYYPGGLTISAADLAGLVSILANDGTYQDSPYDAGASVVVTEASYLSPESVEAMERPQFSVEQADTAPFDQCLILRRQDNLLGREQLYYHTGSAYGVYSLLSYDPDTGDGVVVITSGAKRNVDDRGLYDLCARLSERLYAAMEEHEV